MDNGSDYNFENKEYVDMQENGKIQTLLIVRFVECLCDGRGCYVKQQP